ncbi:MAG: DUF5320 domain-containing protein [Melioribacteraceae bacterium]|nr:DUF5320 domain-containing protein [Melioribacteraceae bacterium]
MPNLDRTGPEGRGPLTGRRMGKCGGKETVNKQSIERDDFVYGRGRRGGARGWGGFGFGGGFRRGGRGFGRGYGYGRRFDDELQNNSAKDDKE